MLLVSRKTLLLTLLIIVTVVISFLLEFKLRHFAGTVLGHSIGILGSFFILIIFLYPLRKYFIQIGTMKEWLDWHMFFGITGPLLIVIHGAFHFHAMAATIAAVVMLVSMTSGIVGRYFYIDARKAIQAKENELKSTGMTPKEIEEILIKDATSVEILGKWRLVHYPIAATFLALMVFHIISVLYYKGF